MLDENVLFSTQKTTTSHIKITKDILHNPRRD